jgi:hypothetical protein
MGATPQAGLDFSDLGAKSIAPVATPQSGGMDFSDLGGKSITASQSAPLTEQDAASGSFANQQARTQTAQEIPPPKETLESMVDSPEIQKMRQNNVSAAKFGADMVGGRDGRGFLFFQYLRMRR